MSRVNGKIQKSDAKNASSPFINIERKFKEIRIDLLINDQIGIILITNNVLQRILNNLSDPLHKQIDRHINKHKQKHIKVNVDFVISAFESRTKSERN